MKILVSIIKKNAKFKFPKWVLRSFIACILLIIVLAVWYKNKPICEKCNVILVSLDTLSALHLPCYGYERNTAPNLCAYADKNIQFMNSYSNAPITLDSHFSIFTSLYPNTHKMTEVLKGSLNEKYLTLAQVFRSNGYQTIYHGSINDIHMPLDRGLERGFNTISEGNIKNWNKAYSELIKNTEQGKPTFLFLHTYAVHSPYLTGHKQKYLFTGLAEYQHIPLTGDEYNEITPEFISFVSNFILNANMGLKSDEKISIKERDIAKKLTLSKTLKEAKEIFNTFPQPIKDICFNAWYFYRVNTNDVKQIEYLKALYDEQIMYNLDWQLDKLFVLMKDPRLAKNTILIITSDHGEEFMEHGNLQHGSNLYRTQTQVPLIIHIPNASPKKIQEMVQGIDIYPTALSLTGLLPKSPIQGIDLSGLMLEKKNAKTNKYLRSEFNGMTAVHYNSWRLYYEDKNKTPKELYDLTDDPKEQKNVIYSNPEKVDEILKLVQE